MRILGAKQGLKKPCFFYFYLKGAERVSKLSPTAKEVKNAYQRAWNAKNKEKLAEYRRRYWQRKADEVAAMIEASKQLKQA
jgi:hypothetical protein